MYLDCYREAFLLFHFNVFDGNFIIWSLVALRLDGVVKMEFS